MLLCASVSPTENGDWETLALWGCVGFLSLPNMRSVILILGTRPVGEGVSRLSSPLQSRLGVTSPLGQHGQPSGGRVDQGPGQGVSVPLHPHHPLPPPPPLAPLGPGFPWRGTQSFAHFADGTRKTSGEIGTDPSQRHTPAQSHPAPALDKPRPQSQDTRPMSCRGPAAPGVSQAPAEPRGAPRGGALDKADTKLHTTNRA